MARKPATGAWGRIDHNPDWIAPEGVLVVRSDGPLMYPNANACKDRVLAITAAASPAPHTVVLDLSQSTELDLQTADTLGELADALARDGIELRLARVRAPALDVLTRSGLAERLPVAPTLDAVVRDQAADA